MFLQNASPKPLILTFLVLLHCLVGHSPLVLKSVGLANPVELGAGLGRSPVEVSSSVASCDKERNREGAKTR